MLLLNPLNKLKMSKNMRALIFFEHFQTIYLYEDLKSFEYNLK